MLDDALAFLRSYFGIFFDDDGRTSDEHECYEQSQSQLGYEFVFGLVCPPCFFEHLYIIVRKAKGAEPYGGDNHEEDINVIELAEEQMGTRMAMMMMMPPMVGVPTLATPSMSRVGWRPPFVFCEANR